MTCAATIVSISHWVGLTLPGMIELPGSFSGSFNSPSPQRGPLPSRRISLAIFAADTAIVLSVPDSSTSVSCAASSANLFGAEVNGRRVSPATSFANASPNPLGALSPVPTAVPPCASRSSRGMTPSIRAILSAIICA